MYSSRRADSERDGICRIGSGGRNAPAHRFEADKNVCPTMQTYCVVATAESLDESASAGEVEDAAAAISL